MSTHSSQAHELAAPEENEVRELYEHVLASWNRRDARGFAALFQDNGECIGFDGSQLIGRAEIAETLRQIFADHLTAPYFGKIKAVRFVGAHVAIVRAIVGMVPPGKEDLEPALNAVQTLVATRNEGTWQIALFQNTPAQLHGRPELVQRMTEELRQLLPG
jgi:uncharacterized protein (TIGR02246 family)